ncbi:MAG: ATP-dependent Clp protease ATP-binding subunit [Acidobacteriaceae bacterium]|nr:ATP-dependent Clp protease ATP-binding subunit [Acidobacteriaceae bacterium]MBV9781036.1 ATP-dependent Clp protease ATP-binding subunit [Acidobacteriaceae bacterium]
MSLRRMLDPTRTGTEADVLKESLHRRVIGQDEAIDEIASAYQVFLTGLRTPARPVGSFLFLGPTGSGKTRIVEATAESLAGTASAVVKIDCAEFQHSHEIAKLIGSPPGYLGHRETHPALSQEVLNQYQSERLRLSFVLFDEIEKASDALWNLLLGILDKGTLTLGDNRKVDFSSAMIFMTSNLGAAEMSAISSPRMGLLRTGLMGDNRVEERASNSAREAARRKFTPEFINRLDKIVVFKRLGRVELERILNLELLNVRDRLFRSHPTNSFHFALTDLAKDVLLRSGSDQRYGARHLKRAVENLLVQPISNLLATRQVQTGDSVLVDSAEDREHLVFFKESRTGTKSASERGSSVAA